MSLQAAVPLAQQVDRHFERGAALSDYPDGLLRQIRMRNAVVRLRFPLERDERRLDLVARSLPSWSCGVRDGSHRAG